MYCVAVGQCTLYMEGLSNTYIVYLKMENWYFYSYLYLHLYLSVEHKIEENFGEFGDSLRIHQNFIHQLLVVYWAKIDQSLFFQMHFS